MEQKEVDGQKVFLAEVLNWRTKMKSSNFKSKKPETLKEMKFRSVTEAMVKYNQDKEKASEELDISVFSLESILETGNGH
jgi:transcriptional regulator with PAS, ATPase and Fis domain